MAGGLFGTPLYLNPKCLVFSAFVLIVYWMPHFQHYEHRIVMNVVLATAAYVFMAWYDVIFDCNDRLRPTLLGWISGAFKPSYYTQEYEELPIKYKKIIRWFDIAVLILMVFLILSPFYFSRK